MLRRIQLGIVAVALVVAAFSTGWPFLFYLVYLGAIVIGGSYVLTRLGLSDLEAGYAVDQLSGHVGDRVRVTYTVRNVSSVPKPWLAIHNPTSLPAGLPGRALSLGPHAERSWLVRTPLTRRGHFRIEPLGIRTGDPFGLFESAATVGSGVTVVVYPRIEPLPRWRLPAADIEGARAAPERTLQTTPLATTVRPWAPGDAFNRIHWKATARHGDIQVKEFELERTADAWIILDLDRRPQVGTGDASTVEVLVRAAASLSDHAIKENRAVALTANGHRMTQLPPDRGARQHLKLMQLLAAVEADGDTPLEEAVIVTTPRIRRGITAVILTSSLDTSWVRAIGALRARGIACSVAVCDAAAFDVHAREEEARRRGIRLSEAPAPDAELVARLRLVRRALSEFDVRVQVLAPTAPLAEAFQA
jgi:uncharacterized protein (DUF58 family)